MVITILGLTSIKSSGRAYTLAPIFLAMETAYLAQGRVAVRITMITMIDLYDIWFPWPRAVNCHQCFLVFQVPDLLTFNLLTAKLWNLFHYMFTFYNFLSLWTHKHTVLQTHKLAFGKNYNLETTLMEQMIIIKTKPSFLDLKFPCWLTWLQTKLIWAKLKLKNTAREDEEGGAYLALSSLSSSDRLPVLTRSKFTLSGWMASIRSRTGMLVLIVLSWT